MKSKATESMEEIAVSPPSRAAWIEMTDANAKAREVAVAAFTGGVD